MQLLSQQSLLLLSGISRVALCCSISRHKSNLADMFEARQGPVVAVASSLRWYITSTAKHAEIGAMMQSS